jgi:prevent-host-death family protein
MSIDACEAQASFPELIGLVASGETISITEHGREVARLVPPLVPAPTGPRPNREGGWMKGEIWIALDIDEAWEEVLDQIDRKQIG